MKKLICTFLALLLCVSLMAHAQTANAADEPTPPEVTEPVTTPTNPEETEPAGEAGTPATAEEANPPYVTF